MPLLSHVLEDFSHLAILKFSANFLLLLFFKTSERREAKTRELKRLKFNYCWERKTDLLIFLIYTMNDPYSSIMQSLTLRTLHMQWLQQKEAEELTMDTKYRFTPKKVPLEKNCNTWSWHCFQWHI